jgi:CHAT domain-containing protein/predicted negative regulator of RcsB-dependent stress response
VSCHPIVSRCDPSARSAASFESFDAAFNSGKSERTLGHTSRAVDCFLEAAALAQTPEQHARALLFAAGSQMRLFRYQAALQSADAALQQALLAGNSAVAGAAASNRAAIYLIFGSNQLASDASREAVSLLAKSNRKDYLARALLTDGDIASKLGDIKRAREELQAAIGIVRQSKMQDVEALAEDHLGLILFDSNDLATAARAFGRAQEIETAIHDRDELAVTKQHLAELAYRQGNNREALAFLAEADSLGGTDFSAIPSYWSPQLRGQILLAMGRRSEALLSFRTAVRSADRWRRYALPGDLTSIQTAATLHTVYRGFVETAAELSLERRDPVLAREALSVLVESRAASLREQRVASLDRQRELPPRYFELLSQLQAAEASLDLGSNPRQAKTLADSLERTRSELADLENKVGISQEFSSQRSEKTLTRISLTGIQRGLTPDELLLSFSLGDKKSFLWGVSRNRLELYQLPSERVVSAHAADYFSAVQKGSAMREGEALSRDLFEHLDASLAAKRQWLIVGDGVLLDRVPFASLPSPVSPRKSEGLIASHSLRLLPSEQPLPGKKLTHAPERFLGVADPIYNLADSRIPHRVNLVAVSHERAGVTLARLTGSAGEVRSAAKTSGLSDIELLTGANASLAKLQEALADNPSVVHFAVHVISASAGPSGAAGDSALALSLTPGGVPELLTKEAIAQLHVPGALVVLSGCASQAGQIVPSAGLIGLGRAWLMAGAAAVIVSAWPTPDDSGEFFSDFYSRLHAKDARTATLAQRASAALQETQIDMQRSAGYRSSPSFWAAYSIISEE